jgi:predicted N-acetyltransferase YhbS
MDQDTIDLVACDEGHLDGALRLSREAGWPHRREDWAMVLSLSQGFAALQGGAVVGIAMMTPFGDEAATVNMVIVSASMRGRGLGRRLMDAALHVCGRRECRLIATAVGLPLYEKLGFRSIHTIHQHQGILPAEAPSVSIPASGVDWARAEDLAAIAAIDREALGMDRRALLALLTEAGSIAVLRAGGRIVGYGALRRFGRGEVIGPVIAGSEAEAQAILSFLMSARSGAFLRIDTPVPAGLSPWLTANGLPETGRGIAMRRGPERPTPAGSAKLFALASQAFG